MQLGAGVAIALAVAVGYLVITQRWQNVRAIFTQNPAPAGSSPSAATNVIPGSGGVTQAGSNNDGSHSVNVGIDPNGNIVIGGVTIAGTNGDQTVIPTGPGTISGDVP